jgi:sensor histidine kinase YesM
MKLAPAPKVYVIGWWVSMPIITFMLAYIMYEDRMFTDWRPWLYTYPLIYAIGYVSWRIHNEYDYALRKRFPGLEHTSKRVFYKLWVNVLVMTPSVLVIFFVFDYFRIGGYQVGKGDLKNGYLVGLSINIIFETLWEVIYIIDKYKETVAEKETLKKMNLEQEFTNLKQKVNPHFLFNCFNTLSSLISEDKDKAERFLDELSKVYRYLLRNNQDEMSTVENEIKFIQSYFQLLKTRHGEGLQLHMQIDKRCYSYLLPSLSLQLLIENAVKHNVVSKSKPLSIEIFTTAANQLVVNNNINRKQQKEKSTRIGLGNIKAKYELLHQEGFQVVEGERNFMVVLPLVWNQQSIKETIEARGSVINKIAEGKQ